MIIDNERDVTVAVLNELAGARDERFKAIVGALVRHLHDFAREVRLTEDELQQACGIVAALGQRTNATHNEVVLAAGSLGLSTLVCLLNNGNNGQTETTANLLGPFWRMHAPRTENGGSIVRSPTPGMPLFVTALVQDAQGRPIAGADVDVWHCSTEGFYENQDPGQADMNLRGGFTTDASGKIWLRSIKPAGYPIPVDGPVGDLLRKQGRPNMRPAHIHFLIRKDGFKTQASQVYCSDDPHLQTDVQFGVTRALIGRIVRHDSGPPPAPDVTGPWSTLEHVFVIERGESTVPRPPITGKATGDRPVLTVLNRAP
jgi:catechol 1,2-dioxygenase